MAFTYTNQDPQWASTSVTIQLVDPEDENNVITRSNKSEPPLEFKEKGQLPDDIQGFYPQYYNFQLDLLSKFSKEVRDNVDTLQERSITTSDTYLSGGGNLSSDRNITLNYNTLLTQLKLDLAPAVGTIMSSDVNPNTTYTGTTWSEIAQGRMLVGRDTGDADFDTIEETGGSKVHTHTTSYDGYGRLESGGVLTEPSLSGNLIVGSGAEEANETLESLNHANSSPSTGSASHLPPYYVTRFWKRTA